MKLTQESNSISDKQLAIIAKLRNVALHQMRKTGYSAQFRTLQKTEVTDDLFRDRLVVDMFENLFVENAFQNGRGEEEIKLEEFIKFCTVKIKHNLIDHMRRKAATKRGGGRLHLSIDGSPEIFNSLKVRPDQINDLCEALEGLNTQSPFHSEVINKKYFLGMTNREIADFYGVSLSKIEKDSRFAISWLNRELSN